MNNLALNKRTVNKMEKKLVRSTNDQMVAGVAAGIAQYFNIDPTIIRLLFVLMAITGGHGLLAYLIMWMIMPEATVGSKADMA
jgi:phage shock protein PspC (stress-responsive transcriptional regulator)